MRSDNILLAALAAAAAPTLSSAAATCTSHTIKVQTTANNRVVFAPSLDLTTLSGTESFLGSGAGVLGQLAGFIPVGGTYDIAAKYCPPVPGSPASRSKQYLLLLHGVPYDSVC